MQLYKSEVQIVLKEVHCLKKELYEKRIYIYEINKDSIDIMLRLSIKGVIINGFISSKCFVGETIFNIPIYDIDSVPIRENCLIVYSKNINNMSYEHLKSHFPGNIYRSDELTYDINPELKNVNVSLYGAGVNARNIMFFLDRNEIEVDEIFVTKLSNNQKSLFKTEIKEFSNELCQNKKLIITPKRETDIIDILSYLNGSTNDIYLEKLETILRVFENTFVLSMDIALKENRNIVFIDEENQMSEMYYNTLSAYNIQINFILNPHLTDISLDLKKFSSNTLFIINIYNQENRWKCLKELYDKGFSFHNFNITSLLHVNQSEAFLKNNISFVSDALVGRSVMYNDQSVIGWKLFRKVNGDKIYDKDEIKIIILGNSTSQPDYYPFKSWPERLFELITKNQNATMYVGATVSDDVINEYLRLIRDFNIIKPDLVISFSGIMNMFDETSERGFNIDAFYTDLSKRTNCFGKGFTNNKNCYETWLTVEQMMKSFTEQNGAKFICFLQPVCSYMPEMNLHEKIQFDLLKRSLGSKEFYDNMTKDSSIYINMYDLFWHKKGMIFDLSHYSEEASSIIANEVYRYLKLKSLI